MNMKTIAETPIFEKYASKIWTDDEKHKFIHFIAQNPESGDVIPNSGGCRKIRWSSSGKGKRGGARIIYINKNEHTIWLLIVYKKSELDNLSASFLFELQKGITNERN
jgi:hypothetical protein